MGVAKNGRRQGTPRWFSCPCSLFLWLWLFLLKLIQEVSFPLFELSLSSLLNFLSLAVLVDPIREVSVLLWFEVFHSDSSFGEVATVEVPVTDPKFSQLFHKGSATFFAVVSGFAAPLAEILEDRLRFVRKGDEGVCGELIGCMLRVTNQAGFLVSALSWVLAEGER